MSDNVIPFGGRRRSSEDLPAEVIAAAILNGCEGLQQHLILCHRDYIYEYRDGVWHDIDKLRLGQLCQRAWATLGQPISVSKTDSAVKIIQHETYQRSVPWDDLGEHEIPCRNGIYDVSTGDIRPHEPENYLLSVLPYEAGVEGDCPTWRDFLDFALGEQEQLLLQEFAGYCLLRHNKYKRALMIYGPPDTGKTVVQEVFSRLVGGAVSKVRSADLGNPDRLAPIMGKAINFLSELGRRAQLDDAGFKQLVSSGEPVQINRKYKDVIEYTPHCKIIAVTNHLPRVYDDSGAVFKRLLLIEMARQPEVVNTELGDLIAEEMQGVFAWAVAGAERLVRNRGQFTVPESSTTAVAEYEQEQDPMTDFLPDYIEPDPESMVKVADLREAYHYYAKTHGQYTMSARSFGLQLKRHGYETTKCKRRGEHRDVRFVVGVRFVHEDYLFRNMPREV